MKSPRLLSAATLAVFTLAVSTPVEARHHYHRYDHGRCLRFNKTTGTVAGAVGGGLLGSAVIGGTGGTLVGAAAGGLAGHSLARNGRKHC